MKTFILMLFLSLTLSMSVSAQAFEQEQGTKGTEVTAAPAPEKEGLFSSITGKVKEGMITLVVGLVIGLFAKNGWSLLIKRIAGRAAPVFRQLGDVFDVGGNFFELLEGSIKDDGKLKENSIKELMAAGKEVIAEANDVIISIRPKV